MQPTNPKSQPLVLPNENNPTADISHSQFLSTRDKARGRYLLVFVLGAVLVSQWPNSFEVNIQLSFHFSQHLVSQVQKNRKKKKKKTPINSSLYDFNICLLCLVFSPHSQFLVLFVYQ